MPNVSVIIPNFNNATYVTTAIASVLTQSYQNFEIIVVDDGSTDDSPAVIARFGDKVRYLRQENQGLAGARNSGIRAAHGDWIALLDADDQWLPTYLATLLGLAERQPQGMVYYCAAQCMDRHGQALPRVLGEPRGTPASPYQCLLRANFLLPSTILMRRQAVVAAGLFDPKLRSCEDWDLWLRLGPNAHFVGTPARLVRYRLHDASLSANVAGMHQAAQAVIEKNFGPADGAHDQWSPAKKRAYGGLYRYFALTLIQRQNNWAAAAPYLRAAIAADETIVTDLDLFYELAWGTQAVGYRGTTYGLELAQNVRQVEQMVQGIATGGLARSRANQLLGTAYYALGLALYNTGRSTESRHFFYTTLRYRPDLGGDRRLIGNLIRSLAGPKALQWLRQVRQQYSV